MAISAAEKKKKIKENRSRAIQQKINLLYARDGSTAPEIDSSVEEDDFNLYQLFGGSKSSEINWEQLGIEGLIRCYYEIIYKINGKKRNNPITNDGETPNGSACVNDAYQRSDLTETAKQVMLGTAYKSGYFVGNASGFEGESESSTTINQNAAKGEYDYSSSTFTDNRDKILISGSYSYPANDSGLLLDQINSAIAIIGEGSLGPHIGTFAYGEDAPVYTDFIPNTILGNRFSDVIPANVISGSSSGNAEDGFTYSDGSYTFGNGIYDFLTNTSITEDQSTSGTRPSGYQYIHRDYYDSSLDTQLETIKTNLEDLSTFIEYTKIDYENYFMNTSIIPGIDDNWATQIEWQNTITNAILIIDNYLNAINSETERLNIDQLIIDLKSNLSVVYTDIESIATTIDSIFGDSQDSSTLYGFRTLWIKNLLDVQSGGSKITLVSIANAIEDADKKIALAEESFGIIGVSLKDDSSFSEQNYWENGIVTPIIGGIETHYSLDQNQYTDESKTIENDNYLQMVADGLIIAWGETAHATSYNIYKSTDYDTSTKTGTWTTIIPSGQTFTVEDINTNTGKVLSYYIDYDVDFDAEENPYYKIKAFDTGRKGDNDYWWYGATSELSDPMSASDFISTASSGTNVSDNEGSASTKPEDLPNFQFKYTTTKLGSESYDNPINKVFESDVEFDTIGSNLEVFVDGIKRNLGSETNDYILVDTTKIEFNNPIESSSIVSLIVYFGSDSGSSYWQSPVETVDNLPTTGNTNGNVTLVLNENALYSWSEDEDKWYKIGNEVEQFTHSDLSDMPDTNGINADHDARYPRREEVNTLVTNLQTQLTNLSYLIPDNAAPLSAALTISDSTFYTGYLSGGSYNNFSTLSAYESFNKIVIGSNFTLESTNKDAEFSDADQGTLVLYINGVISDTLDLGSKFIEDERTTQQSWTPYTTSNGMITISSIYPFNNYGQYQKCDFILNISSNSLTPGENKIILKHELTDETRTTNDFIFFWDPASSTITFDDYSISQYLLTSSKYLSGVRYYSTGDKFTIGFTGNNLFNYTYIKNNQIEIDTSELGISAFNIDYTDSYVTSDGINSVSPDVNTSIIYKNTLKIDQDDIYSINPSLKLIGNQPYRSSDEYIQTFSNYLINTYTQASDDKNEYFVDEVYRLPYSSYDSIIGSYENQWTSKTKLGSNDLLVYNNKLIYPNINFSSGFYPTQSINYSGYTGSRYYLRAFIDSGIPHNNGIFTVKGDIFDDENVKIMIKLPGQTDWLNLKTLYNEADFSGSDDDGCLITYNENSFKWTSGGYSTALSGYMVILRVIMTSASANPIEEISINW